MVSLEKMTPHKIYNSQFLAPSFLILARTLLYSIFNLYMCARCVIDHKSRKGVVGKVGVSVFVSCG